MIFEECESDQSIVPLLKNFPWCKNPVIVESQYRLLQNTEEAKQNCNNDIDAFWYTVGKIRTGNDDYLFSELRTFAKSIICLPHSSAEVERIFSTLKNIKTKLRNKLHNKTVEALLLSKDLLKSSGKKCYEFEAAPIAKQIAKPNLDGGEEEDEYMDLIISAL